MAAQHREFSAATALHRISMRSGSGSFAIAPFNPMDHLFRLVSQKAAQSVLAKDPPVVCVEAANARDFGVIVDFLQPFGSLPFESYNSAPTHVFRAWESEDNRAVLATMAIGYGNEGGGDAASRLQVSRGASESGDA